MVGEGTRRAVFDIGSSSVLLLVAEFRAGEWRRMMERCVVTRLSEGLADTGSLTEAAMQRTTDACSALLQEALAYGPESVVAVGTMALRMATNSAEMLERLAGVGLHARVLQPQEEARLSYLSVNRDPVFAGQVGSVIDIGGASTEICGEAVEHSYPVGAAMLASGLLGPGPCPEPLVRVACEAVDLLLQTDPPQRSDSVATVGSTGVNLASIARGGEFDPDAVHGSRLTLEGVRELRDRVCRMSVDERAELLGLECGRAFAIHSGALILERAMNALGVSEVRISARGLRWGLLDGLAESDM